MDAIAPGQFWRLTKPNGSTAEYVVDFAEFFREPSLQFGRLYARLRNLQTGRHAWQALATLRGHQSSPAGVWEFTGADPDWTDEDTKAAEVSARDRAVLR